MSDVHAAETETAEAPKPSKRKKADLQWLKPDAESGEIVVTKDIAEAVGFRHTVVNTGNAFDIAFDEIDGDVRRMLMAHGMRQKSTDTASGARANEQDEDEAISSLFDDMREGNWRGDRGESVAGVKALAEALAELKGSNNIDAYFELVKGWDEETRKEWRKNPNVQAVIARKKAERLAEKARATETGDGAVAALEAL